MLQDLALADFGDRRLTKRLLQVVGSLAPEPSASFPDAMKTNAALEGTYRFFQNDSVTPERILAPHVQGTLLRAAQVESVVVVAHDTTEFSFSTPREGLGRINDAGRGFFAHYALAVEACGSMRQPLGVLGLKALTRVDPPRRNKHTERIPEEQRESFRWKELVRDVRKVTTGHVSVVHVMDSEADAYSLLSELVEQGDRFVVRVKHGRKVTDEEGTRMSLDEKLLTVAGRFTRAVSLASRSAPHRREAGRTRNLTRRARDVQLEFAATPVTIGRPKTETHGPQELTLNVVHIRELTPPPGEEPVDWRLLTTEPIDEDADLEAIADMYRARWMVEEFFKALKTGCAFEKRQLESLRGLLNALAVFTPIACNLLRLRNLARDAPSTLAAAVLSPLELLVLQRHRAVRLAPNASIRDAMLGVARLGGHITNNGDPGWIVLGRGYEKLLALSEGARMALEM